MFADMSNSNTEGSIARMDSPVYDATSGRCMQFWYHAYGSDVGMMIVYTKAANSYAEIFRDDWTGIDEWMIAEVTVANVLDYQVKYNWAVSYFAARFALPATESMQTM